MAIRLEKAVIRGEVSNEIRGHVTGRIWLAGRAEPLILRLRGNCLRDLAGCVLTFENPAPEAMEGVDLVQSLQEGDMGDMTASRKSRLPAVGDDRLVELLEKGETVPVRLANLLFLEWFSGTNGRVVIEASDFRVEVSEPFWVMDEEQGMEQVAENRKTFHRYLDAITGMDGGEDDEEIFGEDEDEESDDEAFGNEAFGGVTGSSRQSAAQAFAEAFADELEAADDDLPLDEFQWEQELREVDRRAEAYAEACDRYRDHPQRERLIAEAMHWELDEVEEMGRHLAGVADDVDLPDRGLMVRRSEDGQEDEIAVQHPLSRRAVAFALGLQRDAEACGMLGGETGRESPVVGVIVSVIALGGKLAAALDPLEEGFALDNGFVIAMLKRAQIPLNEALHSLGAVETRRLKADAKGWIRSSREELFAIRGEILDLMKRMRTEGI